MTDVHEPDFFDLPSADDAEYWEKFRAAGLHQPAPNGSQNDADGYTWVDLTDPAYQIPPAPPTIEGLLYAGRRHVISGPPESTKTLIAYLLLLTALRQDEGVAILDFEMGPHACVTLLRELGTTNDELAAIHYAEPDGPPADMDVRRLVGLGVGFVLIDAAAGAYDTTGLDDNARKDAEQFAARWIRPLWQAGVATIVIDHVTKNADTRGKFTIGSERKTGQADVHLSLEAVKQLHRGGTGKVKITVMKDRPGHLQRPTLAFVNLTSDPDTHQVTAVIEPAEQIHEDQTVHHTIYAERVSLALEAAEEPMSQNELEDAVKGGKEYIVQGAKELVAAGYATVEKGARGANLYTLVRPFRKTEYDLPTTSPPPPHGEVTHHVPDLPVIPLGIRGGGQDVDDDRPTTTTSPESETTKIDVSDPAIQALLDDPEF